MQGVQGDFVPLPEREVPSHPSLFPRLISHARGAGGLRPPAGARGALASFPFPSPAAAGGTSKIPE